MGYSPNQIPFGQRVLNTLFAIGLFIYGTVGLVQNDIYIPGRRSSETHLHGGPAILVFVAMLCAVIVMAAIVVDHYDRRDNARHYKQFTYVMQFAGWGIFLAGFLWGIFANKR